jgi:uncharacterized membrane protein
MSEEERKEESPETGSQEPVDRLGEELGDTADSVTRDLRDLQDELMPPPAEPPVEVEAAAPVVEPVMVEPVIEEPVLTAPVGPARAASSSGASFTPEGTDDDRLMSMLAWLSMVILQLPIVSIIQLLSPSTKDRPFQRHHAVTSLVFYGAAIVYEIVAIVVYTVLSIVTLGCGAICLWVIFLVPHALGLYYAFQAYGGKRVHLKYLSDWAQKQGWL